MFNKKTGCYNLGVEEFTNSIFVQLTVWGLYWQTRGTSGFRLIAGHRYCL